MSRALHCEGEYWALDFDGHSCRLRDCDGLRYLAQLVVAPGESHAARALIAGRGRDRRARQSAVVRTQVEECARVRVTRALRAVLVRLDRHHPALAQHLRATLRTGKVCAYAPAQSIDGAWQVNATILSDSKRAEPAKTEGVI